MRYPNERRWLRERMSLERIYSATTPLCVSRTPTRLGNSSNQLSIALLNTKEVIYNKKINKKAKKDIYSLKFFMKKRKKI